MKILSFPNFNFNGSTTLPTGFVAVGIAPGSLVDICSVGGYRLGPMSLVPWAHSLTALRGLRTRPSDGGSGTAFPQDQLDLLQLVGYEKCDALVPPGPRAPATVAGSILNGQLQTTAPNANLLLRLPFMGRRMAAFHISRRQLTADLNIVIRGVRYVPREIYAGGAGATVYQSMYDEVVDTLWAGTGARPLSTVGEIVLNDTQYGTNVALGRTIYVGGVDNQEVYDELELYVYGASDAGSDVFATGEAFGEHVV